MNRRTFLIALGSISTVAHADLYDDYLNSNSKQPFIAFLGRKGVPGHAFIGVGVELDNGLRVFERFFGLYPDSQGKLSSVKLIFGNATGKLDYTWSDMVWDTSYLKRITNEQRDSVIAQFLKWSQASPDYSLLGNGGKNCNMLAGDVAAEIQLKVPAGAANTLPWNFIDAIKKANQP